MALNEIAVTKSANASGVSVNLKAHLSNHAHSEYSSISYENGYEVDVLSQFRSNLTQVEDLTRRLRFVMGEVGQLIKSRK